MQTPSYENMGSLHSLWYFSAGCWKHGNALYAFYLEGTWHSLCHVVGEKALKLLAPISHTMERDFCLFVFENHIY